MRIRPAVLYRARVLAGLSQRDLSLKADVNMNTISRLETGQSSGAPKMAKKLAIALGIPIEDLIEFDTEMDDAANG